MRKADHLLLLFFYCANLPFLAVGPSSRHKWQTPSCVLPEKHSASKSQTWYVNPISFYWRTLFFPARSNTSHYWRSAAHSWVYGQCLRSESEWREPPLGWDSCHQYVFHFTVTKHTLSIDVWPTMQYHVLHESKWQVPSLQGNARWSALW